MSSTDEKKRLSFFSKKASVKDSDAVAEKPAEHDAVETAPAAKPEELAPVGFTKLFR
jgi:hypothetical protein